MMKSAAFVSLPRRLGRLILANLSTLAMSAGIVLALVAPAVAIDDDQIPWGPEGTIGRGSESATWSNVDRMLMRLYGRGSESRLQGINYYYMSPRYTDSRRSSFTPLSDSIRGVSRPYLTDRFYEPGDGYRYPLYYNPASGIYFYYPVHR
jgi:hypothetical protein